MSTSSPILPTSGVSKLLIEPLISHSNAEEPYSLNKKWVNEEKRTWIVSLFFGAMMLFAVRTVMSVCALEIAKEFNYDKTQMATLLSSFFYGYPLTQIAGGFLSDKIGGDIVIFYSAVFWAITTFALPYVVIFSDSKYVILGYITLIRTLTGGFQGFHYPGTSSLVSKRIVESERAFTFSFITSGQHLGTLFCGIVGSVVLENYGWRVTFHMVGTLSLCWVYYYRYFVLNKSRAKLSILTAKDIIINGDESVPPNFNALTKDSISSSVPWKEILSKPSFWSLIVAHVCQNNAYYILLTWLPTYFQESYPGSKGWIFNVVPWLISMPATIFAGWLADKMIARRYSVTFVRKFTACVSLNGSGIFLVLISQADSYNLALFLMSCTVFCCGFHNAGIMVNPQDLAPKYAGAVFGIMNTVGALPGFIGVKFAGYILETTKSWSIVFNQTAVLCFFGFVIFFIFGTGKRIVN
jgi:ACS family sodium-dependent inorganic phosphate cotransporter-like MFS transporter 9